MTNALLIKPSQLISRVDLASLKCSRPSGETSFFSISRSYFRVAAETPNIRVERRSREEWTWSACIAIGLEWAGICALLPAAQWGRGGWVGSYRICGINARVYEVTDPVLCSEALEMRRGITEDCCMTYSYGCLQRKGVSFSFVSRGVP